MYTHGYYQDLNTPQVEEAVRKEGFDPLFIADSPGTTYPPHSHPGTKLLAFIRGKMEVYVNRKQFDCFPGDRVLIPGYQEHSALVGPDGCDYFWSEKIV